MFTKYILPRGNKTIVMVLILDDALSTWSVNVCFLKNILSVFFRRNCAVLYPTHPRLRLSSMKVHSMLCLKWSQVIHTWVAQVCSQSLHKRERTNLCNHFRQSARVKMDFLTLNPNFLGPKRLKIKLIYTQQYGCWVPILSNIVLKNGKLFCDY